MNKKTQSNLTPFQPGEQRAVEAGRKGGIASGEAKRERFKALLLAELDAPATRYVPPQKDEYGLIPLDDEGHYETCNFTVRAKLAKTLIAKAQEGDLKALALVLRLSEGEGVEDGEDAGEEAKTA